MALFRLRSLLNKDFLFAVLCFLVALGIYWGLAAFKDQIGSFFGHQSREELVADNQHKSGVIVELQSSVERQKDQTSLAQENGEVNTQAVATFLRAEKELGKKVATIQQHKQEKVAEIEANVHLKMEEKIYLGSLLALESIQQVYCTTQETTCPAVST